jgi:hypothetical protein
MSISSALAFASQGIQAGMNRTAISAGRIAGGISNDPDAAATMIGLNQGAIDTRASMSVVRAADEMLGAIIDIRA